MEDTATINRARLAAAERKGQPPAPLRQRTPQPLAAAQIPDALLTLRTATAITGLSEATLRRRAAADPDFPKFIKSGARCTRLRAGSLMDWLVKQAAA